MITCIGLYEMALYVKVFHSKNRYLHHMDRNNEIDLCHNHTQFSQYFIHSVWEPSMKDVCFFWEYLIPLSPASVLLHYTNIWRSCDPFGWHFICQIVWNIWYGAYRRTRTLGGLFQANLQRYTTPFPKAYSIVEMECQKLFISMWHRHSVDSCIKIIIFTFYM